MLIINKVQSAIKEEFLYIKKGAKMMNYLC